MQSSSGHDHDLDISYEESTTKQSSDRSRESTNIMHKNHSYAMMKGGSQIKLYIYNERECYKANVLEAAMT